MLFTLRPRTPVGKNRTHERSSRSSTQALSEYAGHASVSADSAFDEGVSGARGFAQARLEELGFATDLIETPIHPFFLQPGVIRPGPSW